MEEFANRIVWCVCVWVGLDVRFPSLGAGEAAALGWRKAFDCVAVDVIAVEEEAAPAADAEEEEEDDEDEMVEEGGCKTAAAVPPPADWLLSLAKI